MPVDEAEAKRLDEAVRRARGLCEQFTNPRDIPDNSALRGLLGFATSTPSAAEAVLFVRYQATRANRLGQRRFLEALAEELDARWAGSAEELRRFLGILVRAGIVRRAALQAQRRSQERQRGRAAGQGQRAEGGERGA